MDLLNLPLLAAAALVFASVLAGLFSARIGFSFLLVFLLAGVLAGEDGPGGYLFDDFRLSFWVGNLALAVILLDGGLRTAFATFRTGLRPASLCWPPLGVLVCAGITGGGGVLLLGPGLGHGAAARRDRRLHRRGGGVLAAAQRSGVTLNERVAATLEIESGVNDPMAVYLTLAFIALLGAWRGDMAGSAWRRWLGLRAAVRLGRRRRAWSAAWRWRELLTRVAARDAGGGILRAADRARRAVAVRRHRLARRLGLPGGVPVRADRRQPRAPTRCAPTLAAMDGYAWLAQAGMFLLLGLLVTPSTLLRALLARRWPWRWC